MEEYLQYMRTLRSQINDVEDQAAKISVEEQTLITTIQTMDNDLNFASSETKQFKEDTEKTTKTKGLICSQILEKQRRIAALESDCSTLNQTLELIQQERVGLSAKIKEKSTYYAKVAEDIDTKLWQQQVWVKYHRISGEMGDHGLGKDKLGDQTTETDGMDDTREHLIRDNLGMSSRKQMLARLGSAKAKLGEILNLKSKLATDNSKMKQSIEQVKCRAKDSTPELLTVDVKILEEEYKELLSEKTEEIEYLQSLKDQIDNLKDISHVIKCMCGLEYKVAVDIHT